MRSGVTVGGGEESVMVGAVGIGGGVVIGRGSGITVGGGEESVMVGAVGVGGGVVVGGGPVGGVSVHGMEDGGSPAHTCISLMNNQLMSRLVNSNVIITNRTPVLCTVKVFLDRVLVAEENVQL